DGRLIELVRHVDAKRLKHLLVKFARPFQVRDGEINMVNHGFPFFVFLFDCDSPDQTSAKSRSGLRQDLRHIRLVDTFNNESVIDCPLLAVLRDTLIGFAVIPILSGFHVREFRNDDSLDRIAFKDFMLSIGDEHFDRVTLHRCSDSRPIYFELFLIDGLRSREYNVCRHDRSPVLLSNYSRIALVSRNASIPSLPYSRPMPEYLNPPQGACGSSVMRLITTRPARNREATRRARLRSAPITAA